ncbi:sensor histidine kinase [Aestuariivirga sp.]|uniref:sensor histidine kinase n=1 Tax=Aestuariivirga sp. TaxID=2650926 RepID=UPI0035940B9A
MTEALASRVAGLKLGGIVAVLLLPMLVLSFFMVSSLRQDIGFAQRELLGVEMNRLVMPVAVSAAMGKLDPAAVDALRQSGAAISAELGVKAKFDTALATLLTYGINPRFALDALVALQIDVATKSNIILDPFAETYYLGSVLSQHGPSLLADYVRLFTLASRALKDGAVSRADTAALLLATGAWKESQDRVRVGISEAAAATHDPASYAAPISIAKEMLDHPEHVAMLFARTPDGELAAKLAAADEFGAESGHIIEDIEELWSFSAAAFAQRLDGRLNAMRLRLYALLAIAALACLVGVGGAALMFRSTLKQLDGVKLSRDQAELAQREAEQATREVTRMNEDVVRLNADLARNLAMLREAQDDSLRKGKMAQLGHLTATVAHELRNPLGAVRTSAFLLSRKLKDKGLGIEPQIERINNGITRCDNIISQLLDFARAKNIQPERIAFDDWLARLVEEEAQKLPAAVSIECRLGLDGRSISIDPARMSRAVINLIMNASEAVVGKGDDPSRFAARAPAVGISTALSARGVELTVTDNGPGIAPEHLDKIFEPLFTTKSFGTGLGLPAVQKIMEQHGGGLEFKSAPGQGASFTIWWPVDVPEARVA